MPPPYRALSRGNLRRQNLPPNGLGVGGKRPLSPAAAPQTRPSLSLGRVPRQPPASSLVLPLFMSNFGNGARPEAAGTAVVR